MNKKDLAKKCSAILAQNTEWQERYLGYAQTIETVILNKTDRLPFEIKKPFSQYSAISSEGKYVFDIRFGGQSVGYVKLKKESNHKVAYLVVKAKKASNNVKHFDRNGDYPILSKALKVRWDSDEASSFRSAFASIAKSAVHEYVKSPEHYVENMMLKEFKKGTRAEDKKLCNIQPVRLPGGFFQMPTPFRASKHNEAPKYSKQNGGGIDILARDIHSNNEGRICVMELKDENNKNEPQEFVIEQAITYATFIAQLLRLPEAGPKWWKIIKGISPYPTNRPIDIDVVSVMPKNPDTIDEELEIIHLEEENVNLHLYSLYFELSKDHKSIEKFSGTFPKALKK